MAKIVLSLDGTIMDQHFLGENALTIGRDSGCDLVVPAPEVSLRQAHISTVVNDHFIEDLGSTNGTVVNGKPVSRHLLQNGDVVFLGPYRLRYLNTASAGRGLDRTQLLRPQGLDVTHGGAARGGEALLPLDMASAAAHAARARLAHGRIRGIEGQYAGSEISIERVLLPVGSRGSCMGVINRRPTGCYLVHVSGKVRVQVNGRPLGAEPVLLGDGDVVEAGTDKLEFHSG